MQLAAHGCDDTARAFCLKPLSLPGKPLRSGAMDEKPRLISETVYTESGLRLPLPVALREARWPWWVLAASPLVGVGIAALWQWLEM